MSDSANNLTVAIEAAEGPAICGYLTAGYPTPDRFADVLADIAAVADLIEIGIPFTDPMADGLTIQQASHRALEQGATLESTLEVLRDIELGIPFVLMGYFNPFFSYGLGALTEQLAAIGASGLVIPDLPLEESGDFVEMLDGSGLGLVQLVAPTTPEDRLGQLAEASRGFVYAVTTRGTTGVATSVDRSVTDYLDRVKAASDLPVLAGFGVREPDQVETLSRHVDGVVVASALIDAIDRGDDPAALLAGLRPEGASR